MTEMNKLKERVTKLELAIAGMRGALEIIHIFIDEKFNVKAKEIEKIAKSLHSLQESAGKDRRIKRVSERNAQVLE